MTKLLKNSVLGGISQANVEAYGNDLKAARAKIVATPVVDDTESKSWEKIGPVKRGEATETMKVQQLYEAQLPEHLSLTVAKNGLSVFDNADEMIAFHKAAIADLERLKMMGGATGFNMLRCIEEYIYLQADQNQEWAIGARNLTKNCPVARTGKVGLIKQTHKRQLSNRLETVLKPYALFLAALEMRAKKDFLGASVFLKKEIEDFFLQKNARPDRFFQRAIFERSEKEPVNRKNRF